MRIKGFAREWLLGESPMRMEEDPNRDATNAEIGRILRARLPDTDSSAEQTASSEVEGLSAERRAVIEQQIQDNAETIRQLQLENARLHGLLNP